jgi:hypothetical protein
MYKLARELEKLDKGSFNLAYGRRAIQIMHSSNRDELRIQLPALDKSLFPTHLFPARFSSLLIVA